MEPIVLVIYGGQVSLDPQQLLRDTEALLQDMNAKEPIVDSKEHVDSPSGVEHV
jgi:hypothetical protein